ncbi:large ribosomal subunit protein mL54 isoform 1-T1 [Hipposideros larvatus]
MAARRLFGATRTWAGWRARELPDPAAPGRLLVRDYAKRPVIKGGKGSKAGVVSDALKDPEVCTDPIRLTTHAMGVNIYKEGQDVALKPDAEYPECQEPSSGRGSDHPKITQPHGPSLATASALPLSKAVPDECGSPQEAGGAGP